MPLPEASEPPVVVQVYGGVPPLAARLRLFVLAQSIEHVDGVQVKANVATAPAL